MLSLDEHSVVNFESHPSGWNCYPTGQNGSLELIFATAKNREKLNLLKIVPTGAMCLNTTLMMRITM